MIRKIKVVNWVNRPINSLHRQCRAARTSEDAQGIERSLRRGARPDAQTPEGRAIVIRPGVGRPVGLDAVARRNPRDLRAMLIAIHRIGIGHRRIGAIVGIAREIISADHLRHPEDGIATDGIVDDGAVVGLIIGQRTRPAEIGVLIINARVNDADLDARAGNSTITCTLLFWSRPQALEH